MLGSLLLQSLVKVLEIFFEDGKLFVGGHQLHLEPVQVRVQATILVRKLWEILNQRLS